MNQDMENINKQLQIKIGELIGKDYFKLPPQEIENPNHNFYKVGFEPTLNDVLLAIDRNFLGKTITASMETDGCIQCIDYNDTGEDCSINIPYDLTKSLFSQSEETKLAIIKLLE